MVILKETSQNGFSNIRQVFIESKEDLPSVYHIKKLRPKFEEKEIEPELAVIPEPSRTQSQELVHNKPVVVARIEGTYSDVVDRLEARRKRKYEEISSDEPTYNENYDIVLDSYDGAQMRANQKIKQRNIFQLTDIQREKHPRDWINCIQWQHPDMDAATRG